jgi:aryl-phospho-beta-D-glucosidase BglC (GH1 family)
LHPDEQVLGLIDRYLEACRARKLHMCLNIHRAPGYCINQPEIERHNLWANSAAQDAFAFLWELFAKRYQGVPNDALSFDLLNEPPSEGMRGFTRAIHEKIMRRTAAAIRALDPGREIVLDGIDGGGTAIPELADLGVIHSGRGYAPFTLTHFKAPWCKGTLDLPVPVWPGIEARKKRWDKAVLREFYEPWRAVERRGVRVHIGEFGCFNKTPNDVALAWFADLLSLFKEFRWGYSLWNFNGSFGIVEHGRPGTVYEDWHGYKVDRALLDLYLANRVQD